MTSPNSICIRTIFVTDDIHYIYNNWKTPKKLDKQQIIYITMFLHNKVWSNPSSETQGQLVGAGKSLKTGEKKFGRRKLKNEEKSPWELDR